VGILVVIGGVVYLVPMTKMGPCRNILGLESLWSVRKEELDMAANRVVVRVELDRTMEWLHPEIQDAQCGHRA
jgi:hypothetical protein